jgi:hypothetical protein
MTLRQSVAYGPSLVPTEVAARANDLRKGEKGNQKIIANHKLLFSTDCKGRATNSMHDCIVANFLARWDRKKGARILSVSVRDNVNVLV